MSAAIRGSPAFKTNPDIAALIRLRLLKASWSVLETANKGLFCQLITVPLFKDHKILTQVSGHGSHTIKLLPPLTITQEDCNWIETAFDTVIADSHKVPGAIWSLGKTLVDNAVRKSA